MAKPKLRIIPLGGVGEIGKNMTILEYGNSIIVVDCGVMFPEESMPGIDLVIPDISYLIEKRHKVKAFFITHGHEDHIGALPYILPNFEVPVYSTKLTVGLISVKLRERKLLEQSDLRTVKFGDRIRAGAFDVEFFSVAHSVPDAAGLAIRTPVGMVVHTGDFKIDLTPVDSKPTDIGALARLGTEGVHILMADSTGVERPGYTPSESTVGRALDDIIRNAPGRVIIATFSSLIARIQQVLNVSSKYDRKVAVIGRSMEQNTKMATELGYLHDPTGDTFQTWDKVMSRPADKIVVVTTGAQGEPTSSLSRMANRDHRQITIRKGDTVILSATTIPGNEEAVARNIDNLFRQGANVIYGAEAQVHVSGHPGREELKMLHAITRPTYVVPVHGEARHLILHGRMAEALGTPPGNILIGENGRVMEFTENSARFNGKVEADNIFVDGLGVGSIGDVVLRDRRHLSQDGVVLAVMTIDRRTGRPTGRPDIVSRGFVDDNDDPVIEKARDQLFRSLQHSHTGSSTEPSYVQNKARDTLQKFFFQQTKRRPMVLGIVVEV